MKSRSPHGLHYESLAASGSHYIDLQTGAVVPAIHPSTTFARDDQYNLINPAHGYARDKSPTYLAAEQVLSDLENAAECRLFSSGMAAIASVIQSVGASGHILVPDSFYWGVYSWLQSYSAASGLRLSTYANAESTSLESVLNGLKQAEDSPDLVWVETPSNPFLHVTDIRDAADNAHAAGAMLCVDSTAATPVLTRPLDLGADLIVHSATKYLNGHGDALVGAVLCSSDNAMWQSVLAQRAMAGSVPGNLEAWLLARGMRTLYVRVRQCCSNAMALAEWLERQPLVERVHYPGLTTHPSHAIAKQQMQDGFGGLLSFELKANKAATLQFAGSLKFIVSATSLGGTETLIEHRASVEPPETGVPDNLLRVSVGIERVEDLIEDLQQAYEATFGR